VGRPCRLLQLLGVPDPRRRPHRGACRSGRGRHGPRRTGDLRGPPRRASPVGPRRTGTHCPVRARRTVHARRRSLPRHGLGGILRAALRPAVHPHDRVPLRTRPPAGRGGRRVRITGRDPRLAHRRRRTGPTAAGCTRTPDARTRRPGRRRVHGRLLRAAHDRRPQRPATGRSGGRGQAPLAPDPGHGVGGRHRRPAIGAGGGGRLRRAVRLTPQLPAGPRPRGSRHRADLLLAGSIERIVDGLGEYVAAGATELRILIGSSDESVRGATRDGLESLFGG